MTAWLICKKGLAGVTDRDLIAHYTEVALEDWELSKQATTHSGLGPSTSWGVQKANYRHRLEFLREELERRGLLDEE